MMRASGFTILLLLTALLLAGCGNTTPVPGTTAQHVPAETEAGVEMTAMPAPVETQTTTEYATAQPTLAASDGTAIGTEASDEVQLFAVNVGKGDALILRVGDFLGLIDTGRPWAMGSVRSALERMGMVDKLDAVFITHTDNDHTGGLEWLAGDVPGAEVSVGNWYASAMYTGVKEGKHDAVKAAAKRDQEVVWLRRGDAIPLGETGAVLRVLAPATKYEDKDDNNSLVMLLESAQGRMLLTGDMELPEEAELLGFGDDLSCAVLKVANHGDDDTTSAAFASAASAQLALISTSSEQKPGTPDPGVISRLNAAGSRVLVTQEGGLGIFVTLRGGVAGAEYVDFPEMPLDGVTIAGVEASDDRITLVNSGSEAADLGDYYLYSDRGDEMFLFPRGTILAPGGRLTVGTHSTEGDYDLLWNDKKVVHRKKTDVICLYDRWGRLIDSRENGL